MPVPASAQDQPGSEILLPNKPLLDGKPLSPERAVSGAGILDLNTPNNAQTVEVIDPKDIPETILKEMQGIEKDCETNYFYNSFHNCKCVAVKYLDARIKSDPNIPKERVFNKVANQCPDETAIAGYIYKNCAEYMKNVRKDYVSFCTCNANNVARSYSKNPIMNLRYIESLRRNSMMACGLAPSPEYQSPYSQ